MYSKFLFLHIISFLFLTLSKGQTGNYLSIKIDSNSKGRTYLGIGALSAGASSRLLIDYPNPQRTQIFDLLFKPKFGASLQILKTEIGGDINSTDGIEPSYAHNYQEFLQPKLSNFHRGYESLLMKAATKHNPLISLDCLEWGAPGWIGNGKFYSKDNINYLISYIKNEKIFDSVDIGSIGIWNERKYNINYIKDLRNSLDANQLKKVKIVAADLCCGEEWSIQNDIQKDKQLYNAIGIFGDHYPAGYESSSILKASGKPIENSEGGSVISDWTGFEYLAKLYNRDYIIGKMTRQITWSLITSYYDNLSVPNSGLMTANSPWSGHFEINPTIWAVAHTTQFVEPGWKYLDKACGFLPDSTGSYVTLASNNSPKNYSIIIETMDAQKEQKIKINFSEKKKLKYLHVWRSVSKQQTFTKQKDVYPENNEFILTLKPHALYTLTTTEGQTKGNYISPPYNRFPQPYFDDFEKDSVNQLAKYFSDQGGVFEVRNCYGKAGKCIQQIMKQEGIEWSSNGVFVETIIGDTSWCDYAISTNINVIENTGCAKILGRITNTYRGGAAPDGYWFKIYTDGKWILYAGVKEIKSGNASFDSFVWHKLSMAFKDNLISVFLDNKKITEVLSNEYSHGMAGLGSDFHFVQFDNFSIKKL